MAPEFIALALSIALGLTHVFLHGQAASWQRRRRPKTDASDEFGAPLTGVPARRPSGVAPSTEPKYTCTVVGSRLMRYVPPLVLGRPSTAAK